MLPRAMAEHPRAGPAGLLSDMDASAPGAPAVAASLAAASGHLCRATAAAFRRAAPAEQAAQRAAWAARAAARRGEAAGVLLRLLDGQLPGVAALSSANAAFAPPPSPSY